MKLLELTGLRGVAAFIVVITHCQQFFFPYSHKDLEQFFQVIIYPFNTLAIAFFEFFYDGAFAVMVFWVLSGTVLSLKYFQLVSQQDSRKTEVYLFFSAFKRYFRLAIPVLLSVITAYLLLYFGCLFNHEIGHLYPGEYGQWIQGLFPDVANVLEATRTALWDTFFNYRDSTTYNPVLWTMEKEYMGSIVLFVSLAFLGRFARYRAIFLVAVFALDALHISWLAAFFAGMLISDYCVQYKTNRMRERDRLFIKRVTRIARNRFVVGSLVMVIVLLIGMPEYRGVSNLFLACAVIAVSILSAPVRSFLSTPPLLWLGKISFGLYLSHLLLVASASSALYLWLLSRLGYGFAGVTVTLVTIILALPIGWVFYVLGDKPALWFGRCLESCYRGSK